MKLSHIALTILLITAGILISILFLPRSKGAEPVFVSRRVRWQITVTNPTGSLIADAKVSLFAPLRDGPWQHVEAVTSQPPFDHLDDTGGSGMARYALTLPPYGSAVVNTEALIALYAASRSTVEKPADQWLRSEPFIERDHPELVEVSRSLARATPKDTMRAVFEWVIAHLEEAPYTAEDRGALAALRERRGDCTEFTYLIVALGRAHGVPSRLAAGFLLTDRPTLTAADYHNWAESYWDGRWHLIDGIFEKFDTGTESYLAFRHGGKGEGRGERFFVSDERLTITMTNSR